MSAKSRRRCYLFFASALLPAMLVVSMVGIRAEADQPLADVFWSSEAFMMIQLAEEGLLEAYESDVTSERYSAPFFFHPAYETICAPLQGLFDADRPPRYRPIHWGEFRRLRTAGDYADYGKEVQIEDYRIR